MFFCLTLQVQLTRVKNCMEPFPTLLMFLIFLIQLNLFDFPFPLTHHSYPLLLFPLPYIISFAFLRDKSPYSYCDYRPCRAYSATKNIHRNAHIEDCTRCES
jgi:hypothetical protein